MLKARLHAAESNSAARELGRSVAHADAVVLDRDDESVVDLIRVDPQLPAGLPRRNTVAYGVLDQRLQNEVWEVGTLGGVARGQRCSQPILKARLLNGEILLDKLELIGQRDFAQRIGFERRSQKITQLSDHLLGAGRVLADERRDRVQRVEQKVRTQPALERPELGLGEIDSESRGLSVAFANRPMVRDGVVRHRDECVPQIVGAES